MKRIFALFLALTVILCSVALFACDKKDDVTCKSHRDANDDGKCDSCSASFTDGDETKACDSHKDADDDKKCDSCGADFDDGEEVVIPANKEYTFLIKLDNGDAIPGATFTLSANGSEITLTSGEDGKAKASLKAGVYAISYDFDTLPAGCFPDAFEVEITEYVTDVTLAVIDNNPDGSAQKPFFISEDVTSVSIEANSELYFNYRGAISRHVEIKNENISITYNGNTYTAVNGVVTVVLEPEMGQVTSFSIKNNSSEKIETLMELVSPLGSMDNPIVLEESSVSVTVPAGEAIHYLWTADKDGVLLVSSQSVYNNIALTNTATNAVSALTAGSAGEYIAVSSGDAIRISVASTDDKNQVTVDIALRCYTATEADPVPVIKETVDYSAREGASLVFTAEVGKTLTIYDENVSVTVGGTTYTPDANGTLTLTLEGEGETVAFTVTNTQDSTNGITIEIK